MTPIRMQVRRLRERADEEAKGEETKEVCAPVHTPAEGVSVEAADVDEGRLAPIRQKVRHSQAEAGLKAAIILAKA